LKKRGASPANAYTAFKRGDPDVLTLLRHAEKILMNVTVLGELLSGFAVGNRESENRKELSLFLESPRVTLTPVTEATADLYALIFAALRRKGRPIPTNDLWIAASTLEHGATMLSFDAHFTEIDGLKVGTRLEEFLP
jgi:tRNA(fMet)-specific endonuclease VapC